MTDQRPTTMRAIRQLGYGITRFGVGDEVFGIGEGSYAQSLGATLADNSRSAETFVVLLDPSGHPFWLCSG